MHYKLSKLLNYYGDDLVVQTKLSANLNDINYLSSTNNSKDVQLDSLFIAINGVNINGDDFIDSAIKQGAKIIVSESDLRDSLASDVSFIQVKNARLFFSVSEEFKVANKIKDCRFLGVTGTNGKTTTAYLFFQLLQKMNQRSGLISTVKYFDGLEFTESIQTTPTPQVLFKLFEKMADNQIKYIPMELSSHALKQERIGKIKFNTAIFTNLTLDHLDYHLNMEDYFQAKVKLFREHLTSNGKAIINIDDEYGKKLALLLNKSNVMTFGTAKSADYIIENINLKDSSFTLNGEKFYSNLYGKYNIFNLVGVIISLMQEGFDILSIKEAIISSTLKVAGRLEEVKLGRNFKIFVDYAHTNDALKNVLINLKELPHSKIITIFGCGGNRDRSKRPLMGKVACKYSDRVIVTNDNPRFEDENLILSDILSQLDENELKKVLVEKNRAIAIKTGIDIAEENDIILVAGKGHENYQEINGHKESFNDVEEILKHRGER